VAVTRWVIPEGKTSEPPQGFGTNYLARYSLPDAINLLLSTTNTVQLLYSDYAPATRAETFTVVLHQLRFVLFGYRFFTLVWFLNPKYRHSSLQKSITKIVIGLKEPEATIIPTRWRSWWRHFVHHHGGSRHASHVTAWQIVGVFPVGTRMMYMQRWSIQMQNIPPGHFLRIFSPGCHYVRVKDLLTLSITLTLP